MAGLSCGKQLHKEGVAFTILEAADGVGGRVRSDKVDGFILDRGFQIFLTSYPTARELLDYEALDLKPFYAGALVRYKGSFHRVADPLRHLLDGLQSLTNPVGSPLDKINVGVFRTRTLLSSFQGILAKEETTTLARLRKEGFSEAIIDRFFRPFLGGIFFDRRLDVSSRLFEFVMRCLATGSNCLPAAGIGAVADQMARGLPEHSIHTGVRVEAVESSSGSEGASVRLSDGGTISARRGVVVATDGPAAARLLGSSLEAAPSKSEPGVGTCCLYFSATSHPSEENILYLNGEDGGIVNNLCFPATVAPAYAPAGKALVSVSTIGTYDNLSDEELERDVKEELTGWFGGTVQDWKLLRNYRIPFAQPNQAPPTNFERPVDLGGGLYVCGDHREAATLEGALRSGKRAAGAILRQGAP